MTPLPLPVGAHVSNMEVGRLPSWILKIFIFGHTAVIEFQIFTNTFIKLCSSLRPLDAHNCYMFHARLLGNGRYLDKLSWRTCQGHDEMQVRPKGSIDRPVTAFPTFFQYGGRPPSLIGILSFWTTHDVDYAVRLPCKNLLSIRFSPSAMILPVCLKNA